MAKKKDVDKMGEKKLETICSELPNYFAQAKIISTGIYALDKALCGGLELGSIVQIVGESGTGKTTLCLQAIYSLCLKGMKIVYVDSEGSISQQLLESINVDMFLNKQFFYIRESTFENIEQQLDLFIATNEINFIFIDSLACIIHDGYNNLSKNGLKISNAHSVHNSRQLALFMDKYNSLAKAKNIGFILVNQFRNKVDIKEGTILKEFGGKNVRYNSDVILQVSKISTKSENYNFAKMIKELKNCKSLEFKINKSNKCSPDITIPFCLMYGKGTSNMCNYIYNLLKKEIIINNNGHYSLKLKDSSLIAHGINDFFNMFQNHFSDVDNLYSNEMK